jgi:5-methyltetrahydropteroyltriglutamate--homocysteine methyltransferase
MPSSLAPHWRLRFMCFAHSLGLGVVNPRTEQVKTPAQIRSAVERVLDLSAAELVFLNPDCGFGTLSNRPMNTRAIASAKVAAMAAAARDLRGR